MTDFEILFETDNTAIVCTRHSLGAARYQLEKRRPTARHQTWGTPTTGEDGAANPGPCPDDRPGHRHILFVREAP